MAANETLREIARELSEREWDTDSIRARFRKLEREGIPAKRLDRNILLSEKQILLERVQRRAEEYNLITRNCAQGTALSLLEEFGLGNMQVIKALTNFPGIGGTGEICGGITGSLIALGLFYGGDDLLDFERTGPTMMHAQKFIALFEDTMGHIHCADIQELIFGRNMDPGAGKENMEAFAMAKGFEKCGLPPGIGARLAAEYIIDHME